MYKPKHTVGPWHRNIPPASHYPVIFAGRNTHIASVKSQGLTPDEVEANCDLITSAPALFEALRLIACQSVGDDYPAEEAVAWIKSHARETLQKAGLK